MTAAARQKRHRARGTVVGCVITDPDAIRALRAAQAAYGGISRGITVALRDWLAAREGVAVGPVAVQGPAAGTPRTLRKPRPGR